MVPVVHCCNDDKCQANDSTDDECQPVVGKTALTKIRTALTKITVVPKMNCRWSDSCDSEDEWCVHPSTCHCPEENDSSLNIGSRNHGCGDCQPCVFHLKERGCSKGKDCEFCHICDLEALQRYKKGYHRCKRRTRRRCQHQKFASNCLDCYHPIGKDSLPETNNNVTEEEAMSA